jgi:hypothetical protein
MSIFCVRPICKGSRFFAGALIGLSIVLAVFALV